MTNCIEHKKKASIFFDSKITVFPCLLPLIRHKHRQFSSSNSLERFKFVPHLVVLPVLFLFHRPPVRCASSTTYPTPEHRKSGSDTAMRQLEKQDCEIENRNRGNRGAVESHCRLISMIAIEVCCLSDFPLLAVLLFNKPWQFCVLNSRDP